MKLKTQDKAQEIIITKISFSDVRDKEGVLAPHKKVMVEYNLNGVQRKFAKHVIARDLTSALPMLEREFGTMIATKAFKSYKALSNL